MKTDFACMAEAVAHFYGKGYTTTKMGTRENGNDYRVMECNGKQIVTLEHVALLTVKYNTIEASLV